MGSGPAGWLRESGSRLRAVQGGGDFRLEIDDFRLERRGRRKIHNPQSTISLQTVPGGRTGIATVIDAPLHAGGGVGCGGEAEEALLGGPAETSGALGRRGGENFLGQNVVRMGGEGRLHEEILLVSRQGRVVPVALKVTGGSSCNR